MMEKRLDTPPLRLNRCIDTSLWRCELRAAVTPYWTSLAVLLLAVPLLAPAQDPAIPKQVPGLKPCPGITEPRTFEEHGRSVIEVQVKMDVDVDGAPNAYGPKDKKTLDILEHALAPGRKHQVVGYMTDYDGGPPTIQRKGDPYPGYYVSQTDFADIHNPRMEDPRRYVDASRINYVVLGDAAIKGGVKIGDFVSVYSCRTGKSAYAIVGDSGNPSGAEGSLALVQALGYHIYDGKDESVVDREIVIRYYPGTNPQKQFFKTQADLDAAARKLGLPK
jgi:hypothetical protein